MDSLAGYESKLKTAPSEEKPPPATCWPLSHAIVNSPSPFAGNVTADVLIPSSAPAVLAGLGPATKAAAEPS